MTEEIKKIINKLSPIERKIVPYLDVSIEEIKEKTGIDQITLIRALNFLENKGVLTTKKITKKIIDLGTNGIFYKKNHLPERNLLITLEKLRNPKIEELKKEAKISDNEFKVSLGVLKNKGLIEIKNGRIFINVSKEKITNKMEEEKLLELIPILEGKIIKEYGEALNNLKKRKEIIEIKEDNQITFEITLLGEELLKKNINEDLIEEITPEIIKNWKNNKKFRHYEIKTNAPTIHGGKKHFVNQAIEYGRKVWLELGFKEMSGPIIQTGFWNFDALFTAQDHPVREMQDTFFIKNVISKLPDTKLVAKVKKAHETGVGESKGWQYSWKEEDAKKVVLRTHTTCLSARTLSSLKPKDLPAKFFSIGKCFRNETVDWSHGFEFYQTEGIVVDKDATFLDLLGYLKEFYKKMGFDKIRFTPSYFPYTEPSVEISVYHPEKKIWLEVGGAGIFRPEMVIPLFGEYIPVLAWGQGFDRIIMDYYAIKDLREMYKNNLTALRNKKAWMRT